MSRQFAALVALLAAPFLNAAHGGDLSSHEAWAVGTVREPSTVFLREHVILVWPKDLPVQWYDESRVNGPDAMADWVETAYRFSARWTRFDPNGHYARRNGDRHRLVFVRNGSSDFVFGGVKRPLIGLRDLKNPPAGSEDWFGWIAHELSHDFWHEHPAFERVKSPWDEAMCDYHRHALLLNMGMPKAAANWEQVLRRAPANDAYRGGARVFLKYPRDQRLDGPAALWAHLWERDFVKELGKPAWVK